MALVLFMLLPFAAARPCRVCCENNDSCVYASKASKYENVSHSCCGSSVFGRYYCCPERAGNVSYACKGVIGKCKVVAETREPEEGSHMFLMITCGFILLCMCIANPAEKRKAPPKREALATVFEFDDDDIDADSG